MEKINNLTLSSSVWYISDLNRFHEFLSVMLNSLGCMPFTIYYIYIYICITNIFDLFSGYLMLMDPIMYYF